MSGAATNRTLGTADLVARARGVRESPGVDEAPAGGPGMVEGNEPLAALFETDRAEDYRARWRQVQIGFVDDPGQAVRKADELVAEVISNLAEAFAEERAKLEGEASGEGGKSTEGLRVALQRYRSFFERLLAL